MNIGEQRSFCLVVDLVSNMTENKVTVQIQKTLPEVFEFTINPINTHKWVNGIKSESRDSEEISIGTKYINDTGSYVVSAYEENKLFELTSNNLPYKCWYTYRYINDNTTEMTYTEKMTDGSELSDPFTQDTLNKLKEVMES